MLDRFDGHLRPLMLAFLLASAALLMLPATALADGFVVNVDDDNSDDQCNTQHCSLREAILAANGNPGADTISFNIPGTGPFTIQVLSPLPALSDGGTTIDGTTQSGYSGSPLVMLQMGYPVPAGGEFAGGIVLNSSSNLIRGLSIVGFDFEASSCGYAAVGGGGVVVLSGSGNVIESNYLGLTPVGAALGNRVGVFIQEGANGQSIHHNVISANQCGLQVMGRTQVIQDNHIGTDPAGSTSIGNMVRGIFVSSKDNLIGGTGHGNLISGNAGAIGIMISTGFGTHSGNVIQGNMIGTDIGGTAPLPNSTGIYYIDGEGSLIGGLNPGEGNLVAFNTNTGVRAEGPGHLIQGNEIHDNGGSGVIINGQTVISRNSIYDNGGLGIFPAWIGITLPPSLGSTGGASINGTTCPGCTVEMFLAAPDPTGAGEGKEYLASTKADLNGIFFMQLPIGLESCDRLTGTATDDRPITSPFSLNVRVTPCIFISGWKLPALLLLFPLGIGPVTALAFGRRRRRPRRSVLLRGSLFGGLAGVLLIGGLGLLPFVELELPRGAAHPPEPGSEVDETYFVSLETPVATEAAPESGGEEATPTSTSTPSPTPTATPTQSPEPQACIYEALVNLFCREDSDSRFKAVDSFTPGQTAPIVGEGSEGNHWYVLGPITGVMCTVPKGDQFGIVTGDCFDLPSFTPMPTPADTPTPTPTQTVTPTLVGAGG